MSPDLRVLSLGAGIQSTSLPPMACAAEIDRLDQVAFADTDGELPETYAHQDHLRARAEEAGIGFLTADRKAGACFT